MPNLKYTQTMKIDPHAALEHFAQTDLKMAQLLRSALEANEPLRLPKKSPPAKYFETVTRSI